MSPRIQVYKTIACRVLHRNESPGLNLQSLASMAVDCSGPEVPARAARIQACGNLFFRLVKWLYKFPFTAITTLMSILSAISTGFWSRLGDSYGRKPVLAVFLAGAFAMYCLVSCPIFPLI